MAFTGRAVLDVFPEALSRAHAHPEKRQGGVGARAAWSQTFPLPTHDHAARATLGLRDAIGAPLSQKAGDEGSVTVSVSVSVSVTVAETVAESESATDR